MVVASLVLLAACGGSEKSTDDASTQDSTRTKNAALDSQTIPPANNNITNDQNNITNIQNDPNKINNIQNNITNITNVPNSITNIQNNITNDPNKNNNQNNITNDPNNISNIQNNITNITNITNVPNSITNPNGQGGTCATGGACKVGDIGPGGGIVFYAESTPAPWGQYMEVSQKTLDPRFDTMWCDTPSSEFFPKADALGNGRSTTEWYARSCKRGMLRLAADLVQGNFDDWHLPTLADAKQLYLVRDVIGIEGQWLYTATADVRNKQAFAVNMVDGQARSMNPLAGFAGRAIRAFGTRGPWSCANGGSCKVGDVGPGGGIVFYAESSPQPWGMYMEVSQKTLDPKFDTMWCDAPSFEPYPKADALGNGLNTTDWYARSCKRGMLRLAADLVQGNYYDWHLPTLADAKQMYLVRDKIGIEGQWLYTATPDIPNKMAFAVYMVDGQVKAMNPLAGFAGRAIRTFGDYGDAKPTSATPTTIKPTSISNPITPVTPAPSTTPVVTATPSTTLAPKPSMPTTIAPKPPVATTQAPAPVVPTTVAPKPTIAPTVQSAPSAPSTVAQATACAKGGACKVGDIGPGGGIVFYAATTPQPWGQYYEVSTNLDPRFDTMWCNTPVKIVNVDLTIADRARANAETFARACTKGALRITADFVSNTGRDDWYLPSLEQARAIYDNRQVLKIEGQWFYTSDIGGVNGKLGPIALSMLNGNRSVTNPLAGFGVRAVRSFGPVKTSPTPTNPTPTTIKK